MNPKEILNTVVEECKDRWYLLLLAGIFLLALKIRLFTADFKWLQAFDPYIALRYTSYVVHYGTMPAWDPLSYFPPGRPALHSPPMHYFSAFFYSIFKGSVSSVMEFVKYETAYWGAAMVIPAFLLGKELSDWRAGLLSAVFIGTIPAALRRTMAGFYDTDPYVLFFTLLTMYFFARSFRKRDWLSYSGTIVSLVLFAMFWGQAWYVPVIVIISTIIYVSYYQLNIIWKFVKKAQGKLEEKEKYLLIFLFVNTLIVLNGLYLFVQGATLGIFGFLFMGIGMAYLAFSYFSFNFGETMRKIIIGILTISSISYLLSIVRGSGWLRSSLLLGFNVFLLYIFLSSKMKKYFKEGFNLEKFKDHLDYIKYVRGVILPVALVFILAATAVYLLGKSPFELIFTYVGFSFNPSQVQIVNVSVAELQDLNVLNVFGGAWQRFFSKVSIPLIFSIGGSILLLKRKKILGSLLLTWTAVTFFFITTGIRFMLIFAPAASVSAGVAFSEIYRNLERLKSYAIFISFGFLVSLLVSLQNPFFGVLLVIEFSIFALYLPSIKDFSPFKKIILILICPLYLLPLLTLAWQEREVDEVLEISKAVIMGTAVLAALLVVSQGIQVAKAQKRSPMSENWKEAYSFLKDETPEDAVVGTWWDPGHRIASIAQRRNIADGAHCPEEICDPGLNTRITHLGKILVTKNEDEAVSLLEKYRGNASEMYWIASQDLIGKYQWPQYFGTGCKGGRECPLYRMMRAQNQEQNKINYRGGVSLQFQNDTVIPVIETRTGKRIFETMLMYQNGQLAKRSFEDQENTIGGMLWVHPRYSFVVYIPKFQENSIFTRMYFLEGRGLDHFEQVFRNDYVKIYRLEG